jgi:hypothetical protein
MGVREGGQDKGSGSGGNGTGGRLPAAHVVPIMLHRQGWNYCSYAATHEPACNGSTHINGPTPPYHTPTHKVGTRMALYIVQSVMMRCVLVGCMHGGEHAWCSAQQLGNARSRDPTHEPVGEFPLVVQGSTATCA